MKKFLKYFVCASMLAGIGAGAAISLNSLNTKDIKQADAASLIGSFTRQESRYQSYSKDPTTQNIARSSMATSATWGTNNFSSNSSNSLSLTISENTSNGDWHGIYVAFSYSVTLAPYSSATLSFPCTILTYKDSTSGEADHIAEIQFYDYTSYSDLTLLQLMVDKDNPSLASVYGTGHTDNSGVYRVNKRTTGNQSGSQTFTTSFTNYTSASETKTAYFGFFGYIEQSSTNHHWYATLSINASVTSTEHKASVTVNNNTTYYQTFKEAFIAANTSGGTITLYASETYTEGFAVNNNVTLNLNGFTLTRTDGSASIFGVASNKTFTILGGGGTIKNNGNICTIFVNSGGTLSISNATIENTQSGTTKFAIQLNDGGSNLNLSSNTILKTNGGYGVYTVSGGNVIKFNNITVNSGTSAAIYLHGGSTSSKNTLYIGGACVLSGSIYMDNNSYNTLYGYCDGVPYSGSQTINLEYDTMPSVNDVLLNMLNNAAGTSVYEKFNVKNAPSYMCIKRLNTDILKAIYAYVDYKVTVNGTNVQTSVNNTYATHENNFTTTFSGTSNGYYALPSTITVMVGGVTKTSGTDYSWNQSTGQLVIYKECINGAITIIINGVATNKKAVADFVTQYMHMSDYTQNLGYCSDVEHHYYATAKQALLNLGTDCINEFRTNDAFESAHARYLAWAAANHDSNPFGETSGSNSMNFLNNNTNALLILVVGIIALSFLAVPVIYFKKKHQ